MDVIIDTFINEKGKQRFILRDSLTGEIVDDAQGWGYKTADNAYKCWTYKKYNKI